MIQCCAVVCLLGLAQWMGLQLCPGNRVGECSAEYNHDREHNQQQQMGACTDRIVLALVSPLPLFWLGLGRESRRARWVLLFVFVLALAGCYLAYLAQSAFFFRYESAGRGAYLAYLAQSAFFFRHESAGRGAYLAYLAQSAFFFRHESAGRGA
jgi:hypothetical protein